jgi:hypothetical protein
VSPSPTRPRTPDTLTIKSSCGTPSPSAKREKVPEREERDQVSRVPGASSFRCPARPRRAP